MAEEKNLNLDDGQQTQTDQADASASAGTDGAAGTEGSQEEKLNAFQKFMKTILGEDTTSDDKAKAEGSKTAAKPAEKSYSEDDITSAIANAKKEWEKEQADKKSMEKLSPEERAKVEKENSDKTIAELQKKLLQKDLHDEAVAELNAEGFPVALAKLINYDSKDGMTESLNTVKETFKECLTEAINLKLKGKTPAGLGDAAKAENSEIDEIAKNIRGGF